MDIEEIVQQLLTAKEAYYNTESPLMSDAQFDTLEETLKELDPENSYFTKVGTGTRGKIEHSIPMLSMQKAKSVDELFKWVDKLDLSDLTSFCIMPKIDGLSASCCYINGKLSYVATRGDGTIGQDVTHIAKFIENIPDTINFSKERIEVRGELYLPKDTHFDTKGKPLRNNCVGLVNRKENFEDLRHVKLAAFSVTGLDTLQNESDAFNLLDNDGFSPVTMVKVSAREELEAYYTEYLNEYRSTWLYETDGLVVTIDNRLLFEEIDSRWIVDHHHHYAIAIKPPAEAKETRLVRIEWQVSRQGNCIPVAVFEPVFIGGAKIERASLSNFDTVRKMKINAGDKLLVERANDVIPYVRENISVGMHDDDEFDKIIECPSCSTELQEKGVHLNCSNRECPETNIQKILYWVKSSGIEQIAEATIRTLYNRKLIQKVADLYTLNRDNFENLEGFADKKTESFITEVAASKKMTARDFVSKLGIPLVQKKSLQKLNIFSINDFIMFNDETYIIGQNILTWKRDNANMELFTELISILDIENEIQGEVKKKVCMTGKGPAGRKELIKMIEERGYEFISSITKETSILLTDNKEGSSTKLTKANKLGVEIMLYDEFFLL